MSEIFQAIFHLSETISEVTYEISVVAYPSLYHVATRITSHLSRRLEPPVCEPVHEAPWHSGLYISAQESR